MRRYPVKESPYSSHSVILSLVGEGQGRSLLDVGCADGTMAQEFSKAGWDVTGIEPFSDDAQRARERGVRVLDLSIEEAVEIVDSTFDCIVLGDVLEHCADPWAQLAALKRNCHAGTDIIISLPNIAHIVPRLSLLLGRFAYSDRGIMDRTHLRFFTRRTALQMVSDADLICTRLLSTPTPVELVFPRLSGTSMGRLALAVNARMSALLPRLMGYQTVMVCRICT